MRSPVVLMLIGLLGLAAGPGQAGPWTPLPPGECRELAAAVRTALKLEVLVTTDPFQDPVGGETGTGCRLLVTRGTGVTLFSPRGVARILTAALVRRGWTEDAAYAADGPTYAARGFRKAGRLALISIQWRLAPGVTCPADQPIASCRLRPQERIYTIVLTFAMR